MKYELNVVSNHKDFNGKTLKKYYVDGIDTIGVFGDESFSIVFKNNTHEKIQVVISLDGTNILNGELASTEVSNKMWVVNGYGILKLDAFPETNNGGAGFVFTSADNSVAVHTHGNMSSRGIIAAAVFTEGHVEPVRINYNRNAYYQGCGDLTKGSTINYDSYKNLTYNSSNIGVASANNSTIQPLNLDLERSVDSFDLHEISEVHEGPATEKLKSLVSIGAGQHVDQKITYVTGLIKPMFSETVRVKYLWYDDLVAKLRTQTTAQEQPSGFPGDGERKNIDLTNVPKVGEKKGTFRRSESFQAPVFERV